MRHHCCSKQKVKRGLWSPEEDEKLVAHITSNGHGYGSWSSVPKLAGLQRCGKSCRLRWINYLRPDLRRGSFTEEEEITIIEVHRILGNRWAQIAKHLPGRTDNEVKNFWNSCIKKKLLAQGLDPNTHNLLPSNHKMSKNMNNNNNVWRSRAIPSSLDFSAIQHGFVPEGEGESESEIKLNNIDFNCDNIPTNNQDLDAILGFTTPEGFKENNRSICENSCDSLHINPWDVMMDESSLWDSTLGSLQQPMRKQQVVQRHYYPETLNKTEMTHGKDVSCGEPDFEASLLNTSGFDYCFDEEYYPTLVHDALDGGVSDVENVWGNC